MFVRLLFVVLVALAVGATATSASADVIVEVEIEVEVEVGETAGDVDEAQVVAGAAVLVTDDHPAPRSAPDVRAPVPPFCLGVFRPPRVAFD